MPKEQAGRFCVAFDPLDGSSNIDCNVSTGTIFAVYERTSSKGVGNVKDILRTGNDIVAAGYCMYGAATELVMCFKASAVERFALDPSLGEFIHTHSNVRFPDGGKPTHPQRQALAPWRNVTMVLLDLGQQPTLAASSLARLSLLDLTLAGGKKIYSCNEANFPNWDPPIQKYVTDLKDQGYARRSSARWFRRPPHHPLRRHLRLPRRQKSPKGKLRVLYEGFPMALIVERAGGVASTGMFNGKIQRMLDLVPKDLHERCPVILGSERDVKQVLGLYKKK